VALVCLASVAQPFALEDSPYSQTVERVLMLLPKRPAKVVIVDPNQAEANVRNTLLRMDAFIMKGDRVVYLTSHSEVLKGALKGWSLHEYALASIIWHEMAHIDGAGEVEAQQREESLWIMYVMDARVEPGQGLRYLSTLRSRRSSANEVQHGEAVWTLKGPLMTTPIAVIETSTCCGVPSRASKSLTLQSSSSEPDIRGAR
jgi:hypothetical protein